MRTMQARLQSELDDVLRRHEKVNAHLTNRDRDIPSDWEEAATLISNDEVLEALDDVGRSRIEALQAALERLEDGSYGLCVECGDDIGERRLQALPTTPLCVSCASKRS